MMVKKVLVLSPHTDDGEISAGGTLARFTSEKYTVFYVAFSSCEKSISAELPNDILKRECAKATQELGIEQGNVILFNYDVRVFSTYRQNILDDMIVLAKDIRPELVITPSSYDTHQDHQVIYCESIRAFKKSSSIWGMEHPWNNLSFRTDIFVELEEQYIIKKINALKQYSSQSQKDYFNESYIKSLALTRGTSLGGKFAETFECIRIRI